MPGEWNLKVKLNEKSFKRYGQISYYERIKKDSRS